MGNGLPTSALYRPSQKQFADALVRAGLQNRLFEDAAPLPSGMAVSKKDDRLALTLVDDWAVQYRRVYGYIGEIKLLPACVTWVVLFRVWATPCLWLTMSVGRTLRLSFRLWPSCPSATAPPRGRLSTPGCTAGSRLSCRLPALRNLSSSSKSATLLAASWSVLIQRSTSAPS